MFDNSYNVITCSLYNFSVSLRFFSLLIFACICVLRMELMEPLRLLIPSKLEFSFSFVLLSNSRSSDIKSALSRIATSCALMFAERNAWISSFFRRLSLISSRLKQFKKRILYCISQNDYGLLI